MNVSVINIEKESLESLLNEAADGSSQLPDFQEVGSGMINTYAACSRASLSDIRSER